MDYNKEIAIGDIEKSLVNIVIEIPLGSTKKAEWDPISKEIKINRIEPLSFPAPVNYGFIPKTIGGDGDNLDAFIISDIPKTTSEIIEAKIIGVMMFIDENETDDKIALVDVNNPANSISDIPKHIINQIDNYYSHYKDYIKPGITHVGDWLDTDSAKAIIKVCHASWRNKNTIS